MPHLYIEDGDCKQSNYWSHLQFGLRPPRQCVDESSVKEIMFVMFKVVEKQPPAPPPPLLQLAGGGCVVPD